MNNWSDYPILLAVAEFGSLTAAGKKLNMSQPTVGRRIKALEDNFGTPLLRKEDGSLVPTSFGYSVLDHIRRMQSEASAIDRSSASLEKSLAGPVRISTTEGLARIFWLICLLIFARSILRSAKRILRCVGWDQAIRTALLGAKLSMRLSACLPLKVIWRAGENPY